MDTHLKANLARAMAEYLYGSEETYLAHLLETASQMDTEDEIAAALLRDVPVRTDVRISTVENLFGKEVSEAVSLLSQWENSVYLVYVNRICQNPIARKVELAELGYRMDITRLEHITYEDIRNMEMYKVAQNMLQGGRDQTKSQK